MRTSTNSLWSGLIYTSTWQPTSIVFGDRRLTRSSLLLDPTWTRFTCQAHDITYVSEQPVLLFTTQALSCSSYEVISSCFIDRPDTSIQYHRWCILAIARSKVCLSPSRTNSQSPRPRLRLKLQALPPRHLVHLANNPRSATLSISIRCLT